MSHENVEIVQRAIAAYSGSGEAPHDLFDRATEIWESPELPGDLAGMGYENLARAGEVLLDSFDNWSIDPEQFIDLGERVLVSATFRAKGRGSGVSVDAPTTYLVTVRDGRVVEWRLFGDRGKGLEAAGLSE